MKVKDKFTPEEWAGLLKAPMRAAYAVAGAAPSKQEDFVREMAAVAEGVAEGGRRAPKDSLLGAVVADIVANAEDERHGQTEKIPLDEVKSRALATCRAVAASLETKVTPGEGGLLALRVDTCFRGLLARRADARFGHRGRDGEAVDCGHQTGGRSRAAGRAINSRHESAAADGAP
jgi:hypothetical protein